MRPLAHSPVGLLLVACLLGGCADRWDRSYAPAGEGPHGTAMFARLLAAAWPEADYATVDAFLTQVRPDSAAGALYVAVGDGIAYDSTEVEHLAGFVAAGGVAWLNAEELSIGLTRRLLGEACLEGEYRLFESQLLADTSRVALFGLEGRLDDAAIVTQRRRTPESIAVSLLPHFCDLPAQPVVFLASDDEYFSSSRAGKRRLRAEARDPRDRAQDYLEEDEGGSAREAEPLSRAYANASALPRAYPIVVYIPFGRGGLYLNTAPIFATNAYLAEPAGRAYVARVLGHLPRGFDRVRFDAHRRTQAWRVEIANMPDPDADANRPGNRHEDLLREVLARPPLRLAWYMLLGGALAFVVFGARRRQGVIPVVQPRRNTTLDYLGSVARLYLGRPNNLLMARKQLQLFEAWCLRKYGLRPLAVDDDRARLVSLRGVDPGHVEALLRYQAATQRRQPLSNDNLVQLQSILQSLYRSLGRRPGVPA